MRIHADQDPGQTLKSQKVEFLHEKYRILYVEKRSQNITRKVFSKAFWKGRKLGLFVNFGKFPCYWIRIRIPNTDPDSGQPNHRRSMRIQIHNSEKKIIESYVVSY